MTEVISYGGGVNSTAMTILLANEGWRGPIVFADTGAEWPETYCYMQYFERTWLAPRGLAITRLGMESRQDPTARVLPGIIEFCERYTMIPMAAVRWCTTIFKIEPLKTWCVANGDPTQLIGIAADEAHRRKGRACPLIERGITRKKCLDIIAAEGLNLPQKSGCYICPFQRDDQWRRLWKEHPDLYAIAEELERSVSEKKNVKATLDVGGKLSLTDRRYTYEHQLTLPFEEDLDGYRPCHCTL